VQAPALDRRAGNRDIDTALGGSLEREPQQVGLLVGDRIFEALPDPVEEHAAPAVANAPQRLRELGLAAEVAYARLVELGLRQRAGDRGDCFLFIRLPVHGGDTIQRSSFGSAGTKDRRRLDGAGQERRYRLCRCRSGSQPR
jgi:hypothetical protein